MRLVSLLHPVTKGRPRQATALLLAALLLLTARALLAQDEAKPWNAPGAEAGDHIAGPDGGIYVWVPPGAFLMGSTDADIRAVEVLGIQAVWLKSETPAHRVTLTHGFWLGMFEVTVRQYRVFCEAAGRELPAKFGQVDDCPVAFVNWQDVQAYCQRYGARLPTEAEWEWAARGPENRRYPWGQEWAWDKCHWRDGPGPKGQACPVGGTAASWCGALDMAGNVWEWCADWFSNDYYARSAPTDPGGPDTGLLRASRGGSFRSDPASCRAMARIGADPASRLTYLGFRCAISPKQ